MIDGLQGTQDLPSRTLHGHADQVTGAELRTGHFSKESRVPGRVLDQQRLTVLDDPTSESFAGGDPDA